VLLARRVAEPGAREQLRRVQQLRPVREHHRQSQLLLPGLPRAPLVLTDLCS
jgi:hypothetical protein